MFPMGRHCNGFSIMFRFLIVVFFVSRSDEVNRGHVRSALAKGNGSSIIHAPLAGKPYHSKRLFFMKCAAVPAPKVAF